MACDGKVLIKLAEAQLKKLTLKSELTEDNYKEYKEARGKPLERIIQCHKEKMDEFKIKVDEHTHTDKDDNLHTFEKNIARGLKKERQERFDEKKITTEEKRFNNLLKEQYELNKQIEDYENKTNKINDDMNSNDLLLDEQTTKTNLLKNANIGVLVFVIVSVLYINFKSFFTRKSKMLSKRKENTLFNVKDDKKQYENINNQNKMKYQRELLQRN